MKALLQKIRRILKDRRTRQFLTRIVSVTAAIVVFVTTYALVLPAITMESQAACGIEAHQHDDSCYEERLVCGMEESAGHTHTDACYKTTAVLTCSLDEHRHGEDCYDTDGNIICGITEHIHSEENGCYKEKTELICGLDESEGHQHNSSCYEKVLVCGKEIHTHSKECYKSNAAEIAATERAAVASTESAGIAVTVAGEEADEADGSSNDLVIADPDGISGTELTAGTDAATTGNTASSSGYVPVLNEIYMSAVLNRKTGIYTTASEGASISTALSTSASTVEEAKWERTDDNTELGENDLLRVYLAYTLPAGSLNETNAVARYRLPASIRLTDEQIDSINTTVNGIANQYVNLDTLEILDHESYQASLGIEAVEGTRTPDQDLNDYLTDLQKSGKDAAEYISATVKAENVYDETGETYLGQDLIFAFTPYTVGKNRHEYDADGQPTKAGEEVSGWIAFDLTTEQIVWDQDDAGENDAEENDAKTADIVFAEKDNDLGIHKISTELKLVNTAEDTSEEGKTDEPVSTDDDADRNGSADDSSTAANTVADPDNSEEHENDQADNTDNSSENATQAGTEESASVADDKNESKEENASYPAVSFDDSVTVSAGSLSTDTKENTDNKNTNSNRSTQITVHVEADEDTFPEGTTMLLSAVSDDQMATVAEAVEGAVDAQRTMGFHAVDISFRDTNGNEIEPLKPIKVSMTSDAIQRAVEDESTAPVVVHVEDGDSHTTAETENSNPAPSESSEGNTAAEKADFAEKEKAEPTATVIEANTEGSGKSHRSIDDTLTFEAGSFSVYAIVYTVDFEYSVNGGMYDFSLPGGEKIALSELIEVLGILQETNSEGKTVFASTEDFLKEVANVEFSDESLVQVNQNEEDNDWTLTSLQPFDTEESLTITMKNGDVITVKVTDAQIKKTVISASGEAYVITVTYGEDAGIPEGAELEVEEILPDENGKAGMSSVYDEYLSKTETALGIEAGSASYIRLFDIKIVDKDDSGVKYQPAEGTAVDVRIELADSDSDELHVVHFADENEEGDVVENTTENVEDGAAVEFQAEGFSVYSVVEVSEPEVQDEVTVKSLDDLEGHGFYIVNDYNGYLTANGVSNTKLEGASAKDNGIVIYFEKTSDDIVYKLNQNDQQESFRIYYLNDDNEKVYLYAYETTGNGNGIKIAFGIPELGNYTYYNDTFKVVYRNANTITIYQRQRDNGWNHTLTRNMKDYTWNWANPENQSQYNLTLVYDVPTVNDPYSLDNKSYGIVFNHDSINALALMTDDTDVSSSEVLIRPDVLKHQGTLLVSPDSDISKWTFTCVGEDIYTIQDENDNYLSISSSGVTLKETADESCNIKITAGSGAYAGKIRLSSGGYALSTEYKWDNNTGYAFNGFKVSQTEDAETWFNLADDTVLKDNDFYSYSAEKISASDEILSATQKDESGEIQKDESGNPVYKTEKANVIVYTRVWNDTTKSYEYYAVDHDGTLVRVYESGDNINWVGSSINTMLWEFTEYTYDDGTPNYYYELRNTVYNNYLAPQLMSNQIISDETVGINLNGRRYGQDYTSIIAWDDEAYSFSGLKVENGKVVPCALSEADDFYFAYMHEEEGEQDKFTTVDTVNNNEYGITMKMQNYPYQGYYISGTSNSVYPSPSGGYRSETQADVLGYDNAASPNGTGEGLLSTDLKENGYPDTTYLNNTEAADKSLRQLYSEAKLVNHLFLQSMYNETGYFEYDSTQNFAQLGSDGDFTVYEQLAAGEVLYSKAFHSHGMFLPYNDITKADISEELYNLTDMSAHELPDSDPRKGEGLYTFDSSYPGATGTPKDGATDYFFGMELEASFTQTPNGLDAWGHDIIFEFSGDDDFWLYVDGELVVDLGGVRAGSGASGGAQSAKVNFSTGEVIVNGKSTTLYDLFRRHYDARVRAGSMTEAEETQKLEETFIQKGDNYIFKDYSNHTMKIFYMERGGGASNLHMKFNLAAVKPGTVELSKKLSGSDSESNSLIEFPYQIYYRQQTDGGETYKLLTPTDGTVTYKDSITNVMYKDTLSIDGANYQSVYMLKPGETAVISLPEKTIDYYIVECGVNTDAYDKVYANGTQLTGRNDTLPQDEAASEVSGTRRNFSTTVATTADRPQVEYDNQVAEGAMRTLLISKKLYDTDGETVLSYDADNEALKDETLFDFRLYLGNEYSDELSGANLYSYFVKNSNGQYCCWDRTKKKFTAVLDTDGQPITEYSVLNMYLAALKQAEQETIVFKMSMNGAISKIPAGYSVEVRDLVIGTKWRVEERDNEIPKGYTRCESDGYNRMDVSPVQSQPNPIDGVMSAADSPEVEIRNQKGWGLTVEKIWTDKDFMESHDPIYFAIYYRDDMVSDGLGVMANVQEAYTRTDADNNTISIPAKSSLRQLKNGEIELYYFFDDLKDHNGNAHAFSDYIVREVVVKPNEGTQINVDSDGYVTNCDAVTVTPVENTKTISVGGKPIGGTYHPLDAEDSGYTYTVSYQVGDSTGQNANIRTDTVTNARPGIELYKTDWEGKNLSGAVFSLKDSNGNDVAGTSYTSDSSGLITTAYLSAGRYILTETTAPKGYVGLTESLIIQINEDGSMSFKLGDNTISLKDGKAEGGSPYFSVEKTAASGMDATVRIKNSRNELRAVKVDASTDKKLSGVHFALYRQVKGADGNLRKDLLPIANYEDLETDTNGVIPRITMDLPAGTYYLTETQAAEGYAGLNADICFTIGTDGTVSINSTGHSDWLKSQTDTTSGKMSYTLTIPNGNVKDFTFHKVWYPITGDEKQAWQKDITVTLYKEDGQDGKVVAQYSIGMKDGKLVAAAVSNEDAPAIEVNEIGADNYDYSFTIENLPFGDTYYLVESEMDMNLIKYGKEVNNEIQVTEGASKATEDTLYIINRDTGGYELPSTGGPGTRLFTILGSILIAGAGILLVRRRRRLA